MAKTYGDVYLDRIEGGLTPEQIRERFALMVADEEVHGTVEGLTPEQRARTNLGYILGYYDHTTRQQWYAALPDVSHPVFGPGFGRGSDPTPEEAFEAGQRMAGEK